jgi:two-component system chemotaxis sensor kinase CheA
LSPLDPTLLSIFAAEQAEHIASIRALAGWLRDASAAEHDTIFDDMLRRAHTLKGAARAVGLIETEDLAHSLEDTFVRLREQTDSPVVEGVNAVYEALDRAEDILAAALGQGSERTPVRQDELVRVDAGTLDAVIRASSAVVIASAAEAETGRRFEQHANDIEETLREYRKLRSGGAAECLDYADARLALLRAAASEIAEAQGRCAWTLQKRVRELHENAARARMTPAEVVFGAFGAMAREIAQQEGKDIEFRAEGLHIQADRLVLQSIKDAVMHLLRNAISHGIESPAERRSAGKPAAGSVGLMVSSYGDRVSLAVEDDGRGLDHGALARAAVERGLLTSAAARSASTHEITRLIFQPGFSTAASVTGLAGRGMGLSVVKQAVSALQGEVTVRPGRGGGTVVSLSLPLSISTQRVVLVADHGGTFAFAASQVVSVRKVPLDGIVRVNGRACILVDSDPVPLARLSDLLRVDAAAAPESAAALYVVIVTAGDERAAIAVESIVADREAIIGKTGLQPSEAGFSAGAIALEDGSVAVVLNVGAMLDAFREGAWPTDAFLVPAEAAKTSRILVVDDSITTRSVERSILEAHGFSVELAVDGVEALEKIRANPPDLIISDISMPRMDGFELLERLKKDKETANLPVILVTSLEAREDQERGLSLGADAYIVKRRFDQRELLAAVRQML